MSTTTPLTARMAAIFPDTEPAATESGPPARRPSVPAVGALAFVIAILVAALALGAFNSSGTNYRTAVASTKNVDAALSGVATIEPTLQATIAFPSSGTVASVGVKIGDKVSAGQALAQLQTDSLSQTLDQNLATLANDQLALARALSGQGGGTTAGLGGAGASGTGAAGAGAATGTGTANGASWVSPSAGTSRVQLVAVHAVSNPALAAAQQAVLAAQTHVDSAQGTAAGAVSAAVTACSKDLSIPANASMCTTAVATLNADETAVQNALSALTAASNNLDQIISQLPSPSSNTGSGSGTASPSGAGRTGSAGASAGGRTGGGAATAAPTAADLSADQAAVDAALANVAVAQQALAQATLTSPIAGTVDAVNIIAGQSVTAASSTANIVVQGSGDYQVSTTIGVDNIPHVAVGQSATVSPDGKHKTLSGKVASISVAPNSTSALSTTYLVVVALHDPTVTLGNASTGTVTIVTQHAKSTLAVPTSAVTTSGTTNTVEVLTGGTVRQRRVKVGVVGYTWTQITSGLKKGDQVVLANMSQPLPGSATSSSNSSTSTNNTPFRGGIFGTGRGAGGGGGGGGGVIVPRGG
jgi:multidrug efflux pump subunit AcrA (membrane-fusion protein)